MANLSFHFGRFSANFFRDKTVILFFMSHCIYLNQEIQQEEATAALGALTEKHYFHRVITSLHFS